MLINAEKNEIHLTLGELISFSFPSGSLTKDPQFYEKPKTAAAIAEGIADEDERFMLFHAFSASFFHDGYEYVITAAPDLCAVYTSSAEVANVRASGGKKNAPLSLIDTWKREIACTAAVCAKALSLKEIRARLIYSFDSRMAPEEILCAQSDEEAFEIIKETVKKAARLIKIHTQRHTVRIPAAKSVPFPFKSKRQGQTDFMTAVLKACKSGSKLLCEAPTGIGKTMSALFPSVKAFGHGFIDRIFYLTPKTTAQYAAENAVKTIFSQGGGVRSIILAAKDKMCLLSDASKASSAESDNPESEGKSYKEYSRCERCAGSADYYTRRCDALAELLSQSDYLYPELILEVAKKHTVCPYELSLDASEYCDIIICDYNYLFDCRVYLRRYFDMFMGRDAPSKRFLPSYAVLIDEAHNLGDRARNMYSHTLRTNTLRALLSEFGATELEKIARDSLAERLSLLEGYDKACSENLTQNERGEQCGICVEAKVDERILLSCAEFTERYEAIKKADIVQLSAPVTDFYFNAKDLLKKSEYFSDNFKVLCEKVGANISYRILCLDPSDILEEKQSMAKASVLFSATLTPSEYYMQTLGLREKSEYLSIPSPYDKDNFSLTVFDRLSTRYKDRRETLYALSEIVSSAIKAKKGNYMIFFPSYKYMEELHGFFTVMHPDVDTIVQTKGMTDAQKSAFVARFDENNRETLVGFCVLGGVYAEGIDLVGERLIGSIVVGVGMPKLSSERNILTEHYNEKDLEGMMYSYVYPGMTRVMQAVGRVIRSEEDRGIAILIDDRFATPQYRSLFPEQWRHAIFVSQPKTLKMLLDGFWNDK